MSLKPFYPTINLGSIASLLTLRQQMDLHEDYLEREECPYDEDTRDQLTEIMKKEVIEVEKVIERVVEKRVEVAAAAAEGGGKRGPKKKQAGIANDEVEKEIDDLRTELKNLRVEGKSLQTADKIQIIKTRATLVEKMLAMKERIQNVKRMSLFMSTVMTVLDDLMNDEQRQEFMKRLEPFAEAE